MFFTMMKSLMLTAALARSVNAVAEAVCGRTEIAQDLDFSAKVTENALHKDGVIRYQGILDVDDKPVDMVVSLVPETTYANSKASENNGKKGNEFGRLNIFPKKDDVDSGVGNFTFCFHDQETGDLATIEEFRFSIYDVDMRKAKQNGLQEKVVTDLNQVEEYFLWPNAEESEIKVSCESGSSPPCGDGDQTVFHSSTWGTGGDNPNGPDSLTSQQKKRSIVFVFKDTSCFDMTFAHYCKKELEGNGYCSWYGGGNFLFAGTNKIVDDGECIVTPTDPITDPLTSPPSDSPTDRPTYPPTAVPSDSPTDRPTYPPTAVPSDSPTDRPTNPPTESPTDSPTDRPTNPPTESPTDSPTDPVIVDSACPGRGEMSAQLDFYNSEVTQNDLHEGGVIKYSDIGVVRDRPVDLVVSLVPDTTYESARAELRNGKLEDFGQINLYTVKGDLESGKGDFRFCFHDKETGELTTVDSFRWSAYDLDERNAAANGIKEKMLFNMSQADDFFLWPNAEESEVKTYCEHSGSPPPCEDGERVVFHSSTHGVGDDNPRDPNDLSDKQKKRSVVFTFTNTSCWDFSYYHYCRIEEEEGKSCSWYGGGNFLFAGDAKEIVERGECLTNPPTVAPMTPPPTEAPTAARTPPPTEAPTAARTPPPTGEPTAGLEERGEPGTDDIFFQPPPSCPSDVELVLTRGATEFPDIDSIAAVEVVEQDTSKVTVALKQVWDTSDSVDAIYYEYMPDNFDSKCYGVSDVEKGDRYAEATLQCGTLVPKAKLTICLADDLTKGFLGLEDDASIPRCCKDPEPVVDAPTVCYVLEIECRPGCVGEDSQQAVRNLRGSN